MNRNIAYMLAGAVGVMVVIFGYQYYEQHRARDSIEIKLDDNGISIQKQ
jgi:predicted negative regulator of RcsB-dependent stress response